MTKESTNVVTDTPTKVLTSKLKKKVLKATDKSLKKVVKKVIKPKEKEPKEKVVKKVSARKINSKPVLAKVTGINISPAKVKNIISNFVLNKDAYSALKELKDATPRQIKKTVDGKEVIDDFKGTPVSSLSQSTLDYIKYANECHEKHMKEEYTKTKLASLSVDDRKKYTAAKASAKSEFDNQEKKKYCDDEVFDIESFNLSYDAKFYEQYESDKKEPTTDEWRTAIDKVTKLKNRFSTNSRVYLSALVEYLIKQLATNGTVCCVADKKKIIQLSHILDTSKDGFAERFPLYPMIVNLDTFKQAQKYIKDQAEEKKEPSEQESKTNTKNVDVFKINDLDLDKQYQFRYYIGESCREVRMDLANENKSEESDVYNYTSVSKLFKNFCSSLICEFLMRIGSMLEKEINTRGIKTVNDTVIKTVISHYHIVCGVPETDTVEFIKNSTEKYYSYVSDRQQKRKDAKQNSELAYDKK